MKKLLLVVLCAMAANLSAYTMELIPTMTPEQKAWGLMGRKDLGKNEGMLFAYDPPKQVQFWMFNCQVDLSIAFLDEKGCIVKIVDVDAQFEKMDPHRPVNSVSDFSLYPSDDPIAQYFHSTAADSGQPISYVIEMRKGWFKDHDLGVGDCISLSDNEKVKLKGH